MPSRPRGGQRPSPRPATGVLPVEGLAILFGVHRFMSIAVATTNVVGNSIGPS